MTLDQKVTKLMRTHTVAGIAEVAEISTKTIEKIMAGHKPKLATLESLAGALGVSVAWLADSRANWPPERVRPTADLKQEPQPPVAA